MNKLVLVLALLAIGAISVVAVIEISGRSVPRLKIATTTSLYDTGLLDNIVDEYLTRLGTRLDFIALGTGPALDQARSGDVDAVLVHSPTLENLFLVDNSGGARKIIAYNFFAIVGPDEDPAGVENLSAIAALQKIAEVKAEWVSRDDNSGTNTKEKSLWKSVGYSDVTLLYDENWFTATGQGMGATLNVANEHRAYTIADTGTYLKYLRDNLINLRTFVDSGKDLLNVYSVMAANPIDNRENVGFEGAIDFIEYLISDDGQSFIGNFGVADYGAPLFNPAVQLLKENAGSEIATWIRETAFFENSECPPQYRLGQDGLYQ